MLFDSHAHYDDKAFNTDRDELLKNITTKEVGTVINVGSDLPSLERTLALTERYSFVYGALGIHPCDTGGLTEEKILWMKRQATEKAKIIAIGEIGLDYHWDKPERKIQKLWFVRQLELAREVKLPLIVHSREAAGDTLAILREGKADELGGVMHCFSYTKETARQCLDMNLYLGIGGVVTFKNARKLKEVVEYAPLEKILLETDCPYLAPVPYRGKRNSSEYLPYVAKAIAEIKGIEYAEVAVQTTENARRLFFTTLRYC
jgi:TatD DNase family protein